MTMHSEHDIHAPPRPFLRCYVFSTDHKVIAIQFLLASLFFVLLGGALALAVRYQLAWPNQHVPFAWLLPGREGLPVSMTSSAPESNLALWKSGGTVVLLRETQVADVKIPAGARGRFEGLAEGRLAVTIPAGTRVAGPIGPVALTSPVDGLVDAASVMADYDYARQQVRALPGLSVTVPATDDHPQRTLELLGVQYHQPDPNTGLPASVPMIVAGPILLDIRPAATRVDVHFPRDLVDRAGRPLPPLPAALTATALPAPNVQYQKQTLKTEAYLTLFTMHATLMVFFVLMPVLLGAFGNFLIPLMVGARDMAFPRLNMLSFWLGAPAGLIMIVSFWVPGGASGGGWTMYPPHSLSGYSIGLGTDLWLAAVGLVGFSTIVGTLNYITTIVNMRAPGMHMFRLPLTLWALLITAILALLATPVLTAAAIMLLLDRVLGTHFFGPAAGGQPLMWQHMFWFFGHPEVYILILPAMGITSDVLSTFSRKPIFGYRPMIYAICAIAGLGFVVWGHHMFQSGMNPTLGTTFMAATIMIAVPSAIKTFNWLGTIWGGDIRFTPAMLFALGFVSMFVIGGLSGIFMASAPVDVHIHDTYFIVAHIHYVLFGGTLMGVFAGIYYWFPKMFGRQLNQRWGVVHFAMTLIAINGTFFLMHILGIGGAPRRYASHLEYPTLAHLQPLNVVMTLFAIMLGLGQTPFLFNFFASLPRRLGRAVTALFIVGLAGPFVIGLDFWSRYPGPDSTWGLFFATLGRALGKGLAFAVLVFAATWALWWIGGRLRMLTILDRLLYVAALPLFLCPLILKKDPYLWIGAPAMHEQRWILLALAAIPGLVYLLVARPREGYGYAPGDNPWQANTLEWATSSPPPFHNFDAIPTVHRGPYEYSSPVVEEDYLPQPQPLPAGVVEPAH